MLICNLSLQGNHLVKRNIIHFYITFLAGKNSNDRECKEGITWLCSIVLRNVYKRV